MYEYIFGKVYIKDEQKIVVEANGVGYLLFASYNTITALNGETEKVKVYTHLAVREDALTLYGFNSINERELFYKLISVPKVGPKVALSVLSQLTPSNLISAIITQDIKAISASNGVGKKMAEQIIVTLKDKFKENEILETVTLNEEELLLESQGPKAEALLALTSLGFDRTYALSVINKIFSPEISVKELISLALQEINR